MKILVRLEVH